MQGSPLEFHLAPLKPYLDTPSVSEIMVNGEHQVFVEENGIIQPITLEMTRKNWTSLAHLIASFNHQAFSQEHPLLSGRLPGGERVQLVQHPCTIDQCVVMAIRKQSLAQLSFKDLVAQGCLDHVVPIDDSVCTQDDQLQTLYDQKRFPEFLKKAVEYKKNMLISGGTSSGKTTFARALGTLIPETERILTIEDAHELQLTQPNVVHLLASKGDQGRAKVSILDLLEASLRLRPDRIFVSELRGSEAFAYLRAINSGHPGSITTLHANDPDGAKGQLLMMVNQAGHGLDERTVKQYIQSAIDVIIQCAHTPQGRRVTHIAFHRR